jgi:hypothetical protein
VPVFLTSSEDLDGEVEKVGGSGFVYKDFASYFYDVSKVVDSYNGC